MFEPKYRMGDLVEILSGPFKGQYGRIGAVIYEESSYRINVYKNYPKCYEYCICTLYEKESNLKLAHEKEEK